MVRLDVLISLQEARLTHIRFIPPELDKEHSNISNSENTTLFLLSCYQYVLSAIVLSSGPPFRQSMAKNCKRSVRR